MAHLKSKKVQRSQMDELIILLCVYMTLNLQQKAIIQIERYSPNTHAKLETPSESSCQLIFKKVFLPYAIS